MSTFRVTFKSIRWRPMGAGGRLRVELLKRRGRPGRALNCFVQLPTSQGIRNDAHDDYPRLGLIVTPVSAR